MRGDTVPGAKVSIVNAFFRIEMIEKNVVSDGMAVFPVLFRRDGYRALVPLPKQFDNFWSFILLLLRRRKTVCDFVDDQTLRLTIKTTKIRVVA